MNEEEITQYANWIIDECNEPISEIEWIVSRLPEDVKNEIKDNVLKFLQEEPKHMCNTCGGHFDKDDTHETEDGDTYCNGCFKGE